MADYPDNYPSLTNSPMSTGTSIAKAGGAILGLPTQLFGRALGVPAYQPGAGSPAPATAAVPAAEPTAAQGAASVATSKALDAKYGPSDRDALDRRVAAGGNMAMGQVQQPNAPQIVDPNANVNTWNAHVAQALAGLGVQNAGDVLKQPLPGGDKASGLAALQTTDGATKLLNYGPNNTIVGSGKSASGKLNSFTGVGLPTMQPGSAVPAGAAGADASPFGQVQSHLVDIMQQAAAKRKAGDHLGARGLEGHALRMSQLFQTLSSHMYQQGMLTNAAGQLKLQQDINNPNIAVNSAKADAVLNGQNVKAAKAARAMAGENPDPMQTFSMGSYGIPFGGTPDDAHLYFPQMPGR